MTTRGSFSYLSQPVESWSDLVRAHPISEFSSGSRSTLPLLDFWRDPENALADYRRVLGVQLDHANLSFEHQTPVQRGRGKASHTDLMIDAPAEAIAVEAKFTEPQYELVSDWTGETPTDNRNEVLKGWLSLISTVSGADLDVEAVRSIPYQMVHRSASACSLCRDVTYVVYHLFGDGEADEYKRHLKTLSQACGQSKRLSFVVLETPAKPTPRFAAVLGRAELEPEFGKIVRDTLLSGSLYEFGPIVPTRIA